MRSDSQESNLTPYPSRFPPHSPEVYFLRPGTYIMQNGLIYTPSPNSTFQPPPGAVRVTGRVSGQDVLFQLRRTLVSSDVTPVPANGN